MVTPAKVRGGISAFRKACFMMIALELTPLARASLMYSESSTSSMADLTSRRLAAA